MHSRPNIIVRVSIWGAYALVFLLAIPVLGLLLAALIALIAIPATRKAGWILLALFVGVPLVLIPVAGFFWAAASYPSPSASFDRQAILHDQGIRHEITEKARPPGFPSRRDLRLSSSFPATPPMSPPETPATAPAEKQPIDKAITAESAAHRYALSKVLAKTIVEDPKAWREIATNAAEEEDGAAGRESRANPG